MKRSVSNTTYNRNHDYKIVVENRKTKDYANMLKKVLTREDKAESESEKEDLKVIFSAKVLFEEETSSIDEKSC